MSLTSNCARSYRNAARTILGTPRAITSESRARSNRNTARDHLGIRTLPKKGRASVGVAPQYASALGKNANCQTLVSVTLASSEVPVMIGLRLFLPESWTSDAARMDRAKVPAEARAYRTKPEIALAEIDRARSTGVRFGGILADAGYGMSSPFRQALTERGLERFPIRLDRIGCSGLLFFRVFRVAGHVYPARKRSNVGGRHPLQAEGLSGRCCHDLPGRWSRTTTQQPCA